MLAEHLDALMSAESTLLSPALCSPTHIALPHASPLSGQSLTLAFCFPSPRRYFDTNYHFEVPELSDDSGERTL